MHMPNLLIPKNEIKIDMSHYDFLLVRQDKEILFFSILFIFVIC